MLRWKKILRPAALCLAALLLTGVLPSCRKTGDGKEGAQSAGQTQPEEDAGILTGVYRGESVLLPEGDWQVMSGGGGWNPDAEEMTLFCSRSAENAGEDGTAAMSDRYALLRYSRDGLLLETVALPTGQDGNGAMLPEESGDFIYYAEVCRTAGEGGTESRTVLTRLDRRTGEAIRSDTLDPLFPQEAVQARWGDFAPVFTPHFLAVDGLS